MAVILQLKKCRKCNLEKGYGEFYRHGSTKDGFFNVCKTCYKSQSKKRVDNIIKERKDVIVPENKECRLCNKVMSIDNFCKHSRNYDGLRNICKKCDTHQRKQNRIKEIERHPHKKLAYNIRSLIYNSIRKRNYTKKSKTYDILGLEFDEFTCYIESKFVAGMSWSNYGEWHLDHIVPISLAKSESEVLKLNHYTNFQPLWAEDNIKKSNNLNYKG